MAGPESNPGAHSSKHSAAGQQAAEHFERGLHRVLDNIRDYAIFMVDRDRRVVGWNAGAERILGYSAAEALGMSADVVFTPEDRAIGGPDQEQSDAEQFGRAQDERFHLRKDGTRFYASGVLSSVLDEAGALVGFVKVMQDFTERRRAAEALARSEQRYRLLIESIEDYAIFMLDPSGAVASWTTAAERMMGYTEQEALGQPCRMFFTARDQELGIPEQQLADAVALGRVQAIGWRVRKDGSVFWADEVATAVRDDEGRLQGISRIVRDITDRMLAEDERERLLRRMTEANRLKDEFLGTVSHELRTPLNSILGWTRLLRDGSLDPDAHSRAIAIVERNAHTQARLIEDLLDVSRIVSGQLRLHLEPISLSSTINAAWEAVRPAAEARRIRVSIELGPDADAVVADAARVQQIVWNLLANAIKFTPPGGDVRVAGAALNNEVELIVSDNGVGIAPEFLPFVFDRFRQADSSSTRMQSGLGLGLAIVRHLIELHGGTVEAASSGAGQGATFRVCIPRRVRGASEGAPVRASATPGPKASTSLTGTRVLLVEDDDDSRELVIAALQQRGAEVTAASSAMAARDAALLSPPDVIVADIAMAGEDGYWLLREIRAAEGPIAQTPSIAVTAYATEPDRAATLAAGFQLHLTKPLDLDLLVAGISGLLTAGVSSKRGDRPG